MARVYKLEHLQKLWEMSYQQLSEAPATFENATEPRFVMQARVAMEAHNMAEKMATATTTMARATVFMALATVVMAIKTFF